MSQRQGEAAALGNIGLIYSANGEVDPAARQCFTETLRILGQHGLWRGRDSMRRATALPPLVHHAILDIALRRCVIYKAEAVLARDYNPGRD